MFGDISRRIVKVKFLQDAHTFKSCVVVDIGL